MCSSHTIERLLVKEASVWGGGDCRGRSGQKRKQNMPETKQLGREMLKGFRDIRQEGGIAGGQI